MPLVRRLTQIAFTHLIVMASRFGFALLIEHDQKMVISNR